ncbi:uncharacterized protein LOC135838611 [Planococcus citri]|uniref:uncharacterized protein LOC135838611 n=1 Tax=Planococcus citri TaxID=170843 RepID=UPI0031FA35C4
MAETSSRVYDLTYPSPVTLKEISAIALVAELWRKEIAPKEITTRDELKLAQDILLKKIPDVPSAIYDLLVAYSAKFSSSVSLQLASSDFHYVVRDWDGAVHDVRTAKRKMLCDRLTAEKKFQIACRYCLEDDIRRLWPCVSSNIDLTRMDFDYSPLNYYWICCLKNELHNIPNPGDESIDEVMFDNCELRGEGFCSLEYFWNRIPYDKRSHATFAMYRYNCGLFARFILPRLDDFQLETFLAERGVDFMYSLLINYSIHEDKIHVFPAWMYIKNKISKSQFIELIEKLLDEETNIFSASYKHEIHACCEVWENSPDSLKKWALNAVLLNEELFERMSTGPYHPREMRFLITVLLDASFEQRHKFWCENWRNLITGARVEDLQAVMKLCFRNENDISSFKEQYMSKYENIGPYCVDSLKDRWFKEVNEFLSFCHSDQQKARELKQQVLRSNFLGENSVLRYSISKSYNKELNAFVEDAFDDVDLRVEFKNQFVSSPATQNYLFKCIRVGNFGCLIELVEAFVPEEQDVRVLKQRLLHNFKEQLVSGDICEMKGDNLQKFLVWFLDSEDEIGKFKQSLPVDDILCNVVQVALERRHRWGGYKEYRDKLDDFLNWYFNNDAEEIRKIKERYSDKLKVFGHRE